MSNVIRLLINVTVILTLGYTATASNPAGSVVISQANVGVPPQPFGTPDDFTVETQDAGHDVNSLSTLLLNTIAAIQAVCLVGYTNRVGYFQIQYSSLMAGDMLDFQILEPQDAEAFEARYVLWGLYLCALKFERLPDGDVPLGQGINYCYFRMPGLGKGQFAYEEAPLLNGSSSQLADASNATSKKKTQHRLAPFLGPTPNDTIVADPSSESITSYGSHAEFTRIYNRGMLPVPRLTVFYAFYQVMIARASIPYLPPIPSYSYNLVGLGPFKINYTAAQTPGTPPAELGTVLYGLSQVPILMLSNDAFTECDFDVVKGNKLVVTGSFRRVSGSTSLPEVQVT